MKLTTVLLLIGCLHLSAASYSQTITLDAKESTLKDVFDAIQLQTDYKVVYNVRFLEYAKPVNISARQMPLQQFLSKTLKGQALTYEVREKTILIGRLKQQPEFGKTQLVEENLQERVITGKVTDISGNSLEGVTVTVKGTPTAVITDGEGNYRIQIPAEDYLLVFTNVGFETKEHTVGAQRVINVTMSSSISGLDEVIVVGYGTERKRDVTGAISSIKAADLSLPSNTSIDQALSGRAAGVQVAMNDAQPGGDVSILIRGAASTGAGNEPLYIIDGFPLSSGAVDPGTGSRYNKGTRSPLNTINPNDIESIEILKDVSATAIYGARAANGVILITTKSGKAGTPAINYNFKQSAQDFYKKLEVLNAEEFMRETNNYLEERWKIDNQIDVYGGVDPSTVAPYTPMYTEAEIAQAGKGTDWLDEVTRRGRIQDHNLSINGGSDRTKYFISVNSLDQAGLVKKNNFKRFAGRLNLEQKLFDWLTVGARASGSRLVIDNPSLTTSGSVWTGLENSGVIAASLNFTPLLPVWDENGEYTRSPVASFPNPVSLLDITNNTQQNRLFVQSYLDIEPVANLKIRSQFGFDKQDGTTSVYLPTSTLYGSNTRGMASIGQANKFDKIFNTTVSYNVQVFDTHQLSALVGYEFQEFDAWGNDLNSTFFPTDAFLYHNVGAGEAEPTVGSYKSVDQLASYFTRLNYNIGDKYLFTLTMRADGSSRFGRGNKFGYFPSGAFAWRVIEEEFVKHSGCITDLKLRLSAGQTGNSNISGAFELYGLGQNYMFGSARSTGSYLASYASPNLRWETTTEYNLGLDFGFFSHRISGSIELFSKEVSDLLGSRQLKTYLVRDQIADNLGVTSSKGYEVTLNTVNLQTAFRWNSVFNISAYRDRWKERSPDVVLTSYESPTDPLRVIWGRKTDGFVQPGEVIPHMPGAIPGQLKILDINGYDENNNLTGQPDGILNNADIVKLANADPNFIFGFTNNFEFKNFDLNIHIYGMVGIMRSNPYLANAGSNRPVTQQGRNLPNILGDFWSSENQSAKYPNNYVVNPFPGANQYAIQEADFLRVRNITLGYNYIPNFGKLGSFLKNARVYVDVANAFVFTKYTALDPEFGNGAGDYPLTRTFTLGIDINL